ncbi:restriction endonuclease [Corallococcus macrosporus]|uniref:Restriction endonuclease n=1 Tax=Corallococcus macrosporus TaxID=35 RepID=A0ABS3D2X4_9BACT|nr:NgoMIV family type II restriction endonuclease [Corallococcus macrosporus]MBN8226003.1 restriction endonuclease [Corallococcus macrosporus]
MTTGLFTTARLKFHADLLAHVLTADANGVPANADKDSKRSVKIASSIKRQIELGTADARERMAGQSSGNKFEELCSEFLRTTFLGLQHLRPGAWQVRQVSGRNRNEIAAYEQYAHLAALQRAADKDPELKAALGNDYTVAPDIIITREPEPDTTINVLQLIVDPNVARHAALRRLNNGLPLLHASISCKWTIRSDRSQNSRTEGLNLIKNRKGRLPHVVVVTGEPLPSRLASIAIGTGEIDCVYHFALPELEAAVRLEGFEDSEEILQTMVAGKRLRDIADLPLDLAV